MARIIYQFNGPLEALAELTDAGFCVKAGSQARNVTLGPMSGAYRRTRDRLLTDHLLVPHESDHKLLVLAQDYTFVSSSEAASVLWGNQKSGLAIWRDADGNSPPRRVSRAGFASRRRQIAQTLQELVDDLADDDDPLAIEWRAVFSALAAAVGGGALPSPDAIIAQLQAAATNGILADAATMAERLSVPTDFIHKAARKAGIKLPRRARRSLAD